MIINIFLPAHILSTKLLRKLRITYLFYFWGIRVQNTRKISLSYKSYSVDETLCYIVLRYVR